MIYRAAPALILGLLLAAMPALVFSEGLGVTQAALEEAVEIVAKSDLDARLYKYPEGRERLLVISEPDGFVGEIIGQASDVSEVALMFTPRIYMKTARARTRVGLMLIAIFSLLSQDVSYELERVTRAIEEARDTAWSTKEGYKVEFKMRKDLGFFSVSIKASDQ